MQPVALATGSACNAKDAEPSFVLKALGRSDVLAGASLRLSIGRGTTAAEVDAVASRFADAVAALRAISGDLARTAP